MNDFDKALELLKKFEGFSASPYQCPSKVWTIGFGTTKLYCRSFPAKKVNEQTPEISIAEAENCMIVAYFRASKIAKSFVYNFKELSPIRQHALTMMAYQLGHRLHGFVNTKYFIERQAWKHAAAEMLDSRWRKQTPKRAKIMAQIFRNNQWI